MGKHRLLLSKAPGKTGITPHTEYIHYLNISHSILISTLGLDKFIGLSGSWSMLTVTDAKCIMGNTRVDLNSINLLFLQFGYVQSPRVELLFVKMSARVDMMRQLKLLSKSTGSLWSLRRFLKINIQEKEIRTYASQFRHISQ